MCLIIMAAPRDSRRMPKMAFGRRTNTWLWRRHRWSDRFHLNLLSWEWKEGKRERWTVSLEQEIFFPMNGPPFECLIIIVIQNHQSIMRRRTNDKKNFNPISFPTGMKYRFLRWYDFLSRVFQGSSVITCTRERERERERVCNSKTVKECLVISNQNEEEASRHKIEHKIRRRQEGSNIIIIPTKRGYSTEFQKEYLYVQRSRNAHILQNEPLMKLDSSTIKSVGDEKKGNQSISYLFYGEPRRVLSSIRGFVFQEFFFSLIAAS